MAELLVAEIIKGAARVFSAPVGTAPPANTVLIDEDWGGDWERIGFTRAPLVFGYEFEVVSLDDIQEVLGAIERSKSSEALNIETTAAQLNFDNLGMSWGAQVGTPVAASASAYGYEEFGLGGDEHLPKRALGFEVGYTNDAGQKLGLRAFIWRATSRAGGNLEFSRGNYTGIPWQMSALIDMSKPVGHRLATVRRFTALPTGP